MGIRREGVEWNRIKQEGYLAAQAGADSWDNPVKKANNSAMAWLSGYLQYNHELLCKWANESDRSLSFEDWKIANAQNERVFFARRQL